MLFPQESHRLNIGIWVGFENEMRVPFQTLRSVTHPRMDSAHTSLPTRLKQVPVSPPVHRFQKGLESLHAIHNRLLSLMLL